MLSNILDRISFWALFSVVVLLPVFFLPFSKIPVETSKGLLLVAGLVISIIFYAAARFSDGKVILPKSFVLLSGIGLVLVFLASALFSSSPQMSLFGVLFDIGTFWFILSAYLLMLLSAVVFREKKHARMVLLGLLVSFAVAFIFQILRVFLPGALSLGVLGGKTDSLLGSWNSLGLLAGFTGIVSLFSLEFFHFSKKLKLGLMSMVVLSIIMAILVNFPLVWEMIGVFALIIFIYKISIFARNNNEEDRKKNFPLFSFVIVMISLLFFMSGQFIGSYIPSQLNLTNLEVSPSFSSTMFVTKAAIANNPVLGVGPNNFEEIWSMYKPLVINSTQFWNTSFASGSGLLPTLAATTGILGILALLLFFIMMIMEGVKLFTRSIRNNENADIVVFFIAALFLFAATFFYAAGVVIMLLAFIFTGIFVGLHGANREHGEYHISFLDDPRKSFFSILALVVIMIASAGISFKYFQRIASVQYFGNVVSAEGTDDAFVSINKALSLHQNDLYLRTYVQVSLIKLSDLVTKSQKETLTKEEEAQLQGIFDDAVAGATLATEYNPNNYQNWETLGSVYYTVSLVGLTDAYDKQIEAYKKASELNPKNPGLKLTLANAYIGKKMTTEAKVFVQEALDLKPNYIDALVMMAQIERSLGNNASASTYAESALRLDPKNKNLNDFANSFKKTPVPSTTAEETKESNN